MNPSLKLKKIPEPTNKIIAKEKFPNIGIFAYHSKLVGKSQRKSDNGPIKENMLLMDSKTDCISITPFSMYQFAHSSMQVSLQKLPVCLFRSKFHDDHPHIIYK